MSDGERKATLEESSFVPAADSNRLGEKEGRLLELIKQSGEGGCSNADQLDRAMFDPTINPESLAGHDAINKRLSAMRTKLEKKGFIRQISPKVWEAIVFKLVKAETIREAIQSRPRRLPASNTNVGMVYYLLPVDGLPVRSSIIADKLFDDLDFNDKGWDRPTVGRNVSQILVNLSKQGLVASQGGRRDRTWCRVDFGPAKGVPVTRGRSSYDIGQDSKAGKVLACIKRSPVRGCRFSDICEATGFSKSSVKAALRRIRKLMPVLIENRGTPSNALYFPTDASKEHSFLSRKDCDDLVPVSRDHRNQGDLEGFAGQEEEPDDFGLEDDTALTLKLEDSGGDDGDEDYDPYDVGY